LPEFHGNFLSLSENIAKRFRAATFLLTLYTFCQACSCIPSSRATQKQITVQCSPKTICIFYANWLGSEASM